ncbi:2OG-Fe dioxygenase-domain-containing protein [Colletotrichum phormii]|uniref:2OG-Fe dioxygenase-domain-containing protein n=1 Tax=Colletotrichum phormii TaxID=359342 RepID=A0AAI9ZHK9_9PEZI|nr:2OG-Fe dioxygenase-domain-containing protein [Colletotrichum phormii]KAK1624743.1 2OG-Fe dioxygenase-domain-containing protein [Colletotrichum phormii]
MSEPVPVSTRSPQLNLPAQAYKPDFYNAISTIMQLRHRYIEDRVLFVPGREMARLLKQLGARDEDFSSLQTVSDNLVGDPTLPYRKTRNGRFCLDFDAGTLHRLEFQPFILSKAEDFSRYDSDKVRHFDEVENNLQLNTVFQALMVFKSAIYHGVRSLRRPNMDYKTNKWICTLFSVRTTTTPERLGEPALEGVHTDGVDHTMTTFLGSRNMRSESAVTYVHDMKEVTGVRYTEASPDHIKGCVHHRHFLDTMIVVDSERKHSLSPVYAVDPSRPATRDMLVFFSRKPTVAGHVSADMDSLTPHKNLPMEIPVFVPSWPRGPGGTRV